MCVFHYSTMPMLGGLRCLEVILISAQIFHMHVLNP
uniref:Uncharacterized protein n=1 Tax=Arundo donax TaxID=35708 RepID=A0A0A9G2C6_ARUDO